MNRIAWIVLLAPLAACAEAEPPQRLASDAQMQQFLARYSQDSSPQSPELRKYESAAILLAKAPQTGEALVSRLAM